MFNAKQIQNILLYIVISAGSISLFFSSLVNAENVVLGVLTSSSAQKAGLNKFKENFETNNPGITVELKFRTDADFKVELPNWLANSESPNILTWQGGQRLSKYVKNNQIRDLTEFWNSNDLSRVFTEGALGAVSLDGRVYAVPTSYYQWGFFYRESLFKKLGLSAPNNWNEFLTVCETLKQNGITPITIGTKSKWPTAAWFDYLNLRINGLEFHQALLLGEIPFSDKRVVSVLAHWKELLDKGYFVERHDGWTWLQAMPFMYHKMAGMTLIGNFFSGSMPKELREDFKFFRFPIINKSMAVYEEAPLDLFMVPANKRLTKAVEKVLLGLSNASFLANYNELSGMISPNIKSPSNSDYFIKQGETMLKEAAGLSQFFDRDTTAEMAGESTIIFTDFLRHKNVDEAIHKLEAARQNHLIK